MSLDSTTCHNYHTVTEHDSSNNIVYVHRFTGKSMFGVNCKATYRSDMGHLFNTRNFTLTKATNEQGPCHFNAHPLGNDISFCRGKLVNDGREDACTRTRNCGDGDGSGSMNWQQNKDGLARQCFWCGKNCPEGDACWIGSTCRPPTPAPSLGHP